jgi:hypothetical protein
MHKSSVNYEKWLMSNTDRAWRKSISDITLSAREFYPTETTDNTQFTLPSLTTIFEVTVPENTFGAQAGDFVLALFKTQANVCFS